MSHRERKRKREFYYREAVREGFRSRATYKLKQINDKFNVFKIGNMVLDVGAAPGGWSQMASQLVQPAGQVYAIDLEYMEPIEGVITILGDITKKETHKRLKTLIPEPVDIIISDLSPKVTGNWSTDHARQIYLSEQALRLCVSGLLKKGGKFVCKLFMGDLHEEFISNLKKLFTVVYTYKPKASRKGSAEIYAIAKGLLKGPIKQRKKSSQAEGEKND
ncbi:MAG: RlmE family RNA methyltransferase [Asgard group archaeon]|nr:RlmE family RNA methyltransferase [Asgard group archaeon]